MFLGIHEHELERPQPVLVSVEMLSLYDHPVEDEIREVVDYDFLRLQIEKLAKVQKFALQEHSCDRVAALCLAFSPVMAVAVGSCKIGRESCRERVCTYVSISVVAVALKKKKI